MHPLLKSLSEFSDAQVDEKIVNLQRKYWQTNNPQAREQIAMMLEEYQAEARIRREKQYNKTNQTSTNDLDKLINIS
jgi:hypothetical protein